MTRIQKVAIYNICVVFLAVATMAALLLWTRQPYKALPGMMPLLGLWFSGRIFKGRNRPEWDEREKTIGRRAKLIGYFIFWIFHIAALSLAPYLLGYSSSVPVWLIAYIPITSVYVLLCSISLALIYLACEPPLKGAKRVAFWVIVLLFCIPVIGAARFAYSVPSESPSGGSEVAEWRMVSAEEIVVTSHITLTHWTGDSEMTFTLPYEEAELISVTCSGSTNTYMAGKLVTVPYSRANIPFTKTCKATYSLKWPPGLRPTGPRRSFDFTKIRATWNLPVDALDTVSGDSGIGPYRVRLSGLIPVNSYLLKTVVEPGCGFTLADTEYTETVPFSWCNPSGAYRQRLGSCSLCVLRSDRPAPEGVNHE